MRVVIEGIYSTPNLEVVGVPSLTPLTALEFYRKIRLKPRDAFHIAIMKESKVKEIVSDDEDFDQVDWIMRIGF